MEGKEAALEALAEAVLEHPDDALVVLLAVRDEAGEVVDFVHELVNEAAERNARKPLRGRRQHEVYPVESESMFDTYRHLLATGEVLHTEVEVAGQDPATSGRTYQIYARPVGGERVVAQFRDITELREVERALEQQALHDPLTGLANRRLLLDHLEQALVRLPRHGFVVALLFCDLDDFKVVNDTYGHPVGDALLGEVARRLQAAVRPEDTVARMGGDEFVVLTEGLVDDANALALAGRIRAAVAGGYVVEGDAVSIGMSIGIATTGQVVPVDQLLSRADAALYTAKRERRVPPIALA